MKLKSLNMENSLLHHEKIEVSDDDSVMMIQVMMIQVMMMMMMMIKMIIEMSMIIN